MIDRHRETLFDQDDVIDATKPDPPVQASPRIPPQVIRAQQQQRAQVDAMFNAIIASLFSPILRAPPPPPRQDPIDELLGVIMLASAAQPHHTLSQDSDKQKEEDGVIMLMPSRFARPSAASSSFSTVSKDGKDMVTIEIVESTSSDQHTLSSKDDAATEAAPQGLLDMISMLEHLGDQDTSSSSSHPASIQPSDSKKQGPNGQGQGVVTLVL